MVQPFVLSLDELFFFLGIALTVGYGLSFLLEKYGVPNVVIYLATGFVTGNFLLGPTITQHDQFEFWYLLVETTTLGLIGFKIGIEIEIQLLKEQSKLITTLIVFEVMGAFFAVFAITYVYLHNLILSVILAGLATATAPAATVEVIRRLKADGPMTKKLKWILAFDDLVAVVVVEAILSFLIIIALGEPVTISSYLFEIGQEVGLALIIGTVIGLLLDFVIERLSQTFQTMEFTLATLILVMGLAHTLHTSVILACMMVGVVTVNHAENNFARAESYLDIILSPILIMFFLMVGAQVKIDDFYNPFPIMAVIYFLARALGKISGVFFGGSLAKTDKSTRNYLGLGLLPQGGVALGLTTIAVDILHQANYHSIASTLLVTIVISTVFSEGVGAITTGHALKKAGEVGKGQSFLDEVLDA